MSFFDPRTAAVYGNGGGVQVQDTLNQANIPETDQFRIVSNIDVLNCWQGVTLFDDFVNTQNQIEKPVYNSGDDQTTIIRGQAQMSFDFVLLGYVDVSKMFFEFDAEISNFPPSAVAGNALRNVINPQAQLCFLNNIKRVVFEFGNNNFIWSSQECQEMDGIKTTCLDGAKTILQANIQANLGLSKTRTQLFSQTSAAPAQRNYASSAYDYYFDQFGSEVSFLNNLAVASTTPYKAFKKCAVPFSMLNPFFNRQKVYLPPGLRIKLTIDYIQSATKYYTGSGAPNIKPYAQTVGFGDPTTAFYGWDSAINGKSNPQIIYQYNLLKAASNEKFISMWGSRPLLYNYFDYGKSVYQMRGNRFVDHIFLINHSCPFELYIRPSLTTDVNNNGFLNLKTPLVLGFADRDIVAFYNEVSPFIICSVKIFANGILIKEMDGNLADNNVQYGGRTSEEIITSINTEQQQYESSREVINTDSRMNNIYNTSSFNVILTPGEIYNINKFPIDMGTTQLRVQCWITDPYGNAFDQNFQLQIFYKNPAQLLINDRYTCVSVKWPAISNGSYNFITPTFGAN